MLNVLVKRFWVNYALQENYLIAAANRVLLSNHLWVKEYGSSEITTLKPYLTKVQFFVHSAISLFRSAIFCQNNPTHSLKNRLSNV